MTFIPTRTLPFGHAMTIASALGDLVRPRPPLVATPRTFVVDDETSVVALCSWQTEPRKHPTLIVVHGLTGHADATYIAATAHKAHQRGFNTVRLNVRNCGGTEAMTATLYHTGLTDDLAAVVAELRAEGFARISAIGFSMGGNIVLKYAGEREDDAHLERVVAISPPIEIAEASRAIDCGLINGIYQNAFIRSLAALVRAKAKQFPERYDASKLKGVRRLRTFDDRFIAPCFGFEDADDYYFRASAGRHLDGIRVPTLVITSRDDSIVPAAPIEAWRRRNPPNISFLVTERGGHVGFVAGRESRTADGDPFWAENRAVDWIAQDSSGM